MKAPNIIEALNDKRLFKGLLDARPGAPGSCSSRPCSPCRWSRDELEVFQRHTGRTTAPQKPFREACLVVGRRGGKSRLLALIAVYLAVVADHKKILAPEKRQSSR